MCRVTIFNRNGFQEIENRMGLDNYFQYLIDAQGGHGNGIALSNGSRVEIIKGRGFTAEEAAFIVRKRKYWTWGLFHTRRASAGSICDENCHPFRIKDTVLAMNGHESGFASLAEYWKITDTETLLRIAVKMNLPIPYIFTHFSSVFMGFHKGRAFVVSSRILCDLEVLHKEKSIVFASQFPEEWEDVYETSGKFFWFGGRLPELKKKKKKEKITWKIYDRIKEYCSDYTAIFRREGIWYD